MIKAEVHSDDHVVEHNFDATKWFRLATDENIIKLAQCGWGGDYPADNVAIFMAEQDSGVADVFKYLELIAKDPMKKDCHGFECHVDEEQARSWIAKHRPHLIDKLSPEELEE
jgi:hypothetical protein